jgi:hypothetical protein
MAFSGFSWLFQPIYLKDYFLFDNLGCLGGDEGVPRGEGGPFFVCVFRSHGTLEDRKLIKIFII